MTTQQPHKCPCCDGKGKRYDPTSLWKDALGTPWSECISCSGTGIVWAPELKEPLERFDEEIQRRETEIRTTVEKELNEARELSNSLRAKNKADMKEEETPDGWIAINLKHQDEGLMRRSFAYDEAESKEILDVELGRPAAWPIKDGWQIKPVKILDFERYKKLKECLGRIANYLKKQCFNPEREGYDLFIELHKLLPEMEGK